MSKQIFRFMKDKPLFKSLLWFSVITCLMSSVAFFDLIFRVDSFNLEILFGLVVFLVLFVCVLDVVVYKIVLSNKELVVIRLFFWRKTFDLSKLSRKMELIDTHNRLSEQRLKVTYKHKECILRFVTKSLCRALAFDGFHIANLNNSM
jgi:hypothetical protein